MIIARGARARGNERDQEVYDAIRESVKPDWWPTLHVLRSLKSRGLETATRSNQMTKVWLDLGSALELDKKREQAAYERERKRIAQLCAS